MAKFKSLFLIAALFISVILIGSVSGVFYAKYMNTKNETKQQTQSVQSNEEQSTEKVGETPADDKNYNTALSSLEIPGHKVKPEIEKEVKEAFKVVIKECKTANILEIDFSMEKHLKMADKAPIKSFAVSFQQNGYDVNVDDIEVYESKSSDVVQFIVKSTKKGEDSIFWVGNYNTLAHQVSISNYYGGKVGKAFG